MLEQYVPQEPGREQPNDPRRQDASPTLYAPPTGQSGQPGQLGSPGQFGQQQWQMPPTAWYAQAPMTPQAPMPPQAPAQGPYTGAAFPQVYPPNGYGAPQPYGMPTAPQPPRKRSGALIGVILLVVIVVILGGGAAFALSHKGGTSGTSTTTKQTGGTTVLYSNALTGNETSWLTTDGCSPESDGFHVTADISCFAPTATLSDFSMTVTAQAVGADTSKPYGVTFRSAEVANEQIGNTYVLLIANDGSWTLAKIVDNNVTTLKGSSTASTAIHTDGSANVITVTMRGTHMTASVNGTLIASADDSDIASGLVGIQGYAGGEAVFTNLTITN